jgi:hypothetical protein
MLASQRALFDMPRDVAYFNAAGWSPIPKAVVDAGVRGAARKAQPWTLAPDFADAMYERTRTAAAKVINAEPDDIALVSSVGYGVSTAAKVLDVPRGSRVLVLEDDHTAPVLEWMSRAEAQGFTVETIRRPGDGDWTSAVLEAIDRKGAARLAVVSISSVHWSDGGAIDLATSGCSGPTGGRSSTSPSGTRTACRWSSHLMGVAASKPNRRSISWTPATSKAHGATTWASATSSSRWRWPRSGSRR